MKTINTDTICTFLNNLESKENISSNDKDGYFYQRGWNHAITRMREFIEKTSINENDEFQQALTEALNSPILTDVEQHGHAIVAKEYIDDKGQHNTVAIYGFDNELYLVSYVNGKCVQFQRMYD